jgi:hypothetical protein
MALRKPALDPQPFDVISRDGLRIEVTKRDGDTVYYITIPLEGPGRSLNQPLIGWQRWAGGFKVKHRGQSAEQCTVVRFGISGPCTRCKQPLVGGVHVFEDPDLGLGLFCADCCDAKAHYKVKEKVSADQS